MQTSNNIVNKHHSYGTNENLPFDKTPEEKECLFTHFKSSISI